MANPDHLAVLRKGASTWNAWRAANPEVLPDLHRAQLQGADLREVDFRWADLWGANFQGTLLEKADFREAFLGYADLQGADLRDADFENAELTGVKVRVALDDRIHLGGTGLVQADLKEVLGEGLRNVRFGAELRLG